MRSILLFSGIGAMEGPPVPQLVELYARPENANLFDGFFDGVDAALARVGKAVYEPFLPDGIPLREWLTGGTVKGRSSILEGLCSHMYHLCLVQPGAHDLGPVVASVGHSLGLQSAVVAAFMLDDREAFVEVARRSVTALALGLLYAHQVGATSEAEPALRERYRSTRDPQEPSPMCGVMGVDVDRLGVMIAEHNRASDTGHIEIVLINSNRFCVLAGATATLLAFWGRFERMFKINGVRWFYLNATAPFHSRALEPAARLFVGDRDFVDFPLSARDVAVPVYTTSEPGNLQESQDLYGDTGVQIVCRAQDWRVIISRAVNENGADRVVNFGPGLAAQTFTRACLRDLGLPMRFMTVTQTGEHPHRA